MRVFKRTVKAERKVKMVYLTEEEFERLRNPPQWHMLIPIICMILGVLVGKLLFRYVIH